MSPPRQFIIAKYLLIVSFFNSCFEYFFDYLLGYPFPFFFFIVEFFIIYFIFLKINFFRWLYLCLYILSICMLLSIYFFFQLDIEFIKNTHSFKQFDSFEAEQFINEFLELKKQIKSSVSEFYFWLKLCLSSFIDLITFYYLFCRQTNRYFLGRN